HKDRIASLVHFISDPEISLRKLVGRKYAWGVIGVQYHARKVALDALRTARVPVVRQTRFRKLMALAKKLRLMLNEPRPIQRWFNSDYQHRLESSRYAFACGSAIDMPVRKFFEIPAAGAVLVCKPFCGFEAAGFRDGVNAIACDPQDIMDVHRSLEADPERAQAIADAGRRLVFTKHSLATRAAQLRETLSAMADGSFAGARWNNGEYTVARKTAA
ncbi:MAG TPA: glycosyltransferase, partial [Bradyrhizobium sp.]|nr:glycosyltransferase [Bradyrhizobium sp.]